MKSKDIKFNKFTSLILSLVFILLFVFSSCASIFGADLTHYHDYYGITLVNDQNDLYTYYGLTRVPKVTVNNYALAAANQFNDGVVFDIDLNWSEMFTFLITSSRNWVDEFDPLAKDASAYTFEDTPGAMRQFIHYGKAVSDFVIRHQNDLTYKYESKTLIGKLFGSFYENIADHPVLFNNWLEAIIADESDGVYSPDDVIVPLITDYGYKVYYNLSDRYFRLVYDANNVYNVKLDKRFITPTDYRVVYYYLNDSPYYNQDGNGGTPVDIYTDGESTTVNVGDDTITNNTYNQNPENHVTFSNDASQVWDIASGASVTFDNTAPVFDASQKQWFVPVYNNYYYTYNNYYTYYNYNYYMPGTDIPFSTYDVFFELPDGRSSTDMTYDEIKGSSVGWHLMNYTVATEDPYQQALFHFDGTIDNSGAYNPLDYVNTSLDLTNSLIKGWANLSSSNLPSSYYSIINESDGSYTFNFSGLNGVYFGFMLNVPIPHNTSLSYNFSVSGARYQGGLTSNPNSIVSNSIPSSGTVYSSNYDYYQLYCYNLSSSITINIKFSFSSWEFSNIVQIDADNPTHFEWVDNAIYQFVTTGDDNYGGALYLDGLIHKFKINQTVGSVSSGKDFTASFRYYQEVSTNQDNHYFYIGGDSTNSLAYILFTGEKIGALGSGGSFTTCNEKIPVGSWNTITVTRANNVLFLFLNGLKIAEFNVQSNFTSDDYVCFYFPEDNNVKYLDEYMYANIALYTGDHVPRLVPFDTSNVLVQPVGYVPNFKTLAVKSIIPVHSYRIGGVRFTYPEYGDVYCHLTDSNYIDSVQQWNGYMWIEVDCSLGVDGHWFSKNTFNVSTLEDNYMIQPPPGTVIEAETTIWDWLGTITSPITTLLQSIANAVGGAVDSVGSLITGIFNTVKDLILDLLNTFITLISTTFTKVGLFFESISSAIVNFTSSSSPVLSAFGNMFNALPNSLQILFTGAFSLLLFVAFIVFLK